MKKYKIANIGNDNSNWFDMELTDDQLKTVIELFEANNKIATYCCTPHLHIYEYDESKNNVQEYKLRLNRDYEELNKDSKKNGLAISTEDIRLYATEFKKYIDSLPEDELKVFIDRWAGKDTTWIRPKAQE